MDHHTQHVVEGQIPVVTTVAIEQIRPNPRQPRTVFDEQALAELAASIRMHGILQPLIVSEYQPGQYELIAGERRLRAAQRAGLISVPVLVRETTPQEMLEVALIENVQRADLSAIEEAQAYQLLKDEFGLSDDLIARQVGKSSREVITNARRLLKLPTVVQEALLTHRISAGHGRALLKFATGADQARALQIILEDDLTVRETERLSDLAWKLGDLQRARGDVRPARAVTVTPMPETEIPRSTATKPQPSPDDHAVQRELERLLGTPVMMLRTERAVRVTLTFYDDEKLQEFLMLLGQG